MGRSFLSYWMHSLRISGQATDEHGVAVLRDVHQFSVFDLGHDFLGRAARVGDLARDHFPHHDAEGVDVGAGLVGVSAGQVYRMISGAIQWAVPTGLFLRDFRVFFLASPKSAMRTL